MSTTWIKAGYGVLLGVALALAVGFGTAIFATEPRPPQSPGLSFAKLSGQTTDAEGARIQKSIDSYYDDVITYREKYPDYQRNIFIAFASAGLLLAIIGVALPALVNYLRLGFLFGGLLLLGGGAWFAVQPVPQATPPASSILTLLSVGTPKVLDDAGRFLRFAVAIVGVLLLLFVGLWRLTDWSAPARRQAAVPEPYAPGQPTPAGLAMSAPAPAAAPSPRPPAEALKWARPEDRAAAESAEPRPAPPEAPAGAGLPHEGSSAPSA